MSAGGKSMKKWLIHQPPEEAAKQIRSGSDLSMLCAQVGIPWNAQCAGGGGVFTV